MEDEFNCYHCGTKFGLLESRYTVRVQSLKFHKRKIVGYACETCIEGEGLKTNYHLWLDEKPNK